MTTGIPAARIASAILGCSGSGWASQLRSWPPSRRYLDQSEIHRSYGGAATADSGRSDSAGAKSPGLSPADVVRQLKTWLDAQPIDPAVRQQAIQLWPDKLEGLDGGELLERLADSFALVDPRGRDLVAFCAKPHAPGKLPDFGWLADANLPPLLAKNLRLYYGRYLARESLFEESLDQLLPLDASEVVDPVSLLFYQAVLHQRLLHRNEGLKAVERLVQEAEASPKRYAVLAKLMEADLKNLKEETVDHIARRMDDVRRRLDLGRAGPKVRAVEDGVIESLDKLIKKLEEEQQQQDDAGGNLRPGSPAQESRIMEGKGPGEVVQRKVGDKSGWGNLPPKQREEALQQIGREFPAHYREVIEQYFRKLAAEGSP